MLLAAADRSDPDHAACRDLLEAHPGPLVTTELVIAETGWLIDRQLGPAAEAALYESAATGEIRVEPLSAEDWTRIAALTIQYADQHLGGVDSSLIAIAERLGASTIGTLDRRHFGVAPSAHRRLRAASVSQPGTPTTACLTGLHGSTLGCGPTPPHPFNEATTPTTRTLSSCHTWVAGSRGRGLQKAQARRDGSGAQVWTCSPPFRPHFCPPLEPVRRSGLRFDWDGTHATNNSPASTPLA